jgi:AbrB family looped-hinge helix DNA binding protein
MTVLVLLAKQALCFLPGAIDKEIALGSQTISVRLSTKGQLVVPKEICQRFGWTEGMELVLEDRGDGVLVRPARQLPETALEDLVGCTGYKGPAKTLAELEAGIATEARKRR